MLRQCRRVINLQLYQKNFVTLQPKIQRQFCKSCILNCKSKDEKDSKDLGNMRTKYQVFKDKDAPVILDVYEERLKYQELQEQLNEDEGPDPFQGLNLERGINGVFEIEDLVDVLRKDNGKDICVIEVSSSIQYVDFICCVTGNSNRHMSAIAQFVKKVYKRKRHETDIVPKIEGKGSKHWLAIDLGNIALHIFSEEGRKLYDLDSLWALGSEFDKECNKAEDPTNQLLEKHSIYLHDLHPAN